MNTTIETPTQRDLDINPPASYAYMVSKLLKPGDDIVASMDGRKADMLHAAVGIAGEAGEILKALTNINFESFDEKATTGLTEDEVTNLKEEIGDHVFYETALRQAIDMSELVYRGGTIYKLEAEIEKNWDNPRYVLRRLGYHHAVLASDILDMAKKSVMYNKELDILQIIGLMLEDAWVISTMIRAFGSTMDEIREGNMKKLLTGKNARYAEGYSDAAAVERADKTEDEAPKEQ